MNDKVPDALVETYEVALTYDDDLPYAKMIRKEGGRFVKTEDYERLQSELGSLAGELAAAKTYIGTANTALDSYRGELQDERAKLRAARAELGMVRGKCDRLRKALKLLLDWTEFEQGLPLAEILRIANMEHGFHKHFSEAVIAASAALQEQGEKEEKGQWGKQYTDGGAP